MQSLYVLIIVVLVQLILTAGVYHQLRKLIEWKFAKNRRIVSRRLSGMLKIIDTQLDENIEVKEIVFNALQAAEAAQKASEAISARFDRGEELPKPKFGASLDSLRKNSEDRFVKKIEKAKAIVRGQETAA